MNKHTIDCTAEISDIAKAISEVLGSAEVASLHCPWDNEFGTLYLDDAEIPEVHKDDIIVTRARNWGELNSAWAARIAAKFEASI